MEVPVMASFPKANGTFQASEAMEERLANITGRAIEQAITLLRKANRIQDTGKPVKGSHSVEKLKEMAARVVEAATKHLQEVKMLSETMSVMTPHTSTHSPSDDFTAENTPKLTASPGPDLTNQTISQNGFLPIVEGLSDPKKIQQLLDALNSTKNMFSR